MRRAIREARSFDQTRNALFTDAFCLDTEAVRRTVAELERLDATFVAMGVEHVLERHAEAPAATPRVVRPATQPATACRTP